MTKEKTEKKKSSLNLDLGTLFSKRKTTKNDEGLAVPDNSLDNYVPALPEVNLLPPSVKEKYASQDMAVKFAKTGVAIATVFGLIFTAGWVMDMVQDSKLNQINAETQSINIEIQALAPYSQYLTEIEAKRQSLSQALSGTVDTGAITQDFKKLAKNAGYELNSYSLSVQNGDGALEGSCVNPDPFTPSSGIGCINFTLEGDGNLGNLYKEFNKEGSGFINIYVPSTSNEGEDSSVNGSVSVTTKYALDDAETYALPLESVISNDNAGDNANSETTPEEGTN